MLKILACTDGSAPYGASVIDHAAWAAGRLEAAVEVLHVLDHSADRQGAPADLSGSIGVDAREDLLAQLAELDAAKGKIAMKRARLVLDDAKARLEKAGVAEIALTQRHGTLVDTLNDLEAAADLLVIGKRGEGHDVASAHLGANLERVVRASRRPVLVASRAFHPVAHALIAFDGSASARRAVEWVTRRPLLAGLRCTLLSVGYVGSERQEQIDWAMAQLHGAGVAADAVTAQGDPEEVIASTVRDRSVDLLAMGAYGHSRIRALIVGSTTTSMIRTCKIPLLMFR